MKIIVEKTLLLNYLQWKTLNNSYLLNLQFFKILYWIPEKRWKELY